MYESDQNLVLGQIAASIRHGLINPIEERLADMRFCQETGRSTNLADLAITPVVVFEVRNWPNIERNIETIRHWASL